MTVSMRVMSAGDGYKYLLRTVAAGDGERSLSTPLTRYYAEEGSPPGRWLGSSVRSLGDGQIVVGDPVSEEQLQLLVGMGRDPITGETSAAIEVEETARGTRRAVAGFDFTFSVPKSASVLWAVADAGTQALIVDAHHAAVAEMVAFMEREVAATRTGATGRDGAIAQVDVTGLIATAFDHYDSRAGDPNLHTHVVISNKVRTTFDEKWRSLDGRPMHAAVVALSELHEAVFADHLSRALGVEWEQRERGCDRNPSWAISTVPAEIVAEFSSRSRHIDTEARRLVEEWAAAHGRQPSNATIIRLRQQATLTTRPEKEVRSLADLTAGWRERASNLLGQDATRWARTVTNHETPVLLRADDVPLDVVAHLGQSVVEAVGEKRSTWRRWNLYAEAARQTMGWRFASTRDREAVVGMVVDAAEAASMRLTPPELAASPAVFQRPDGTSVFRPKHSVVFSSEALLAAEDRLLALEHDRSGPVVGPDVVERITERPDVRGRLLGGDQAAALASVAVSGRVIDVLVGPAGAGKTTAMNALRRAWEVEYGAGSVVGLAPSAIAAQVLADDLGIATENTAKWWQNHLTHGTTFTARQLVIIDEASLAGTLTLDRIAGLAADAGAKVLLVGDWAQLQSVDAGGAFAMLVGDRDDAPELVDVHRFTHAWEKTASLGLRHGRPSAIDTYADNDRIIGGDTEEMMTAAYIAWRHDRAAGLASILIAETGEAVTELNKRARADLILDGIVEASREVGLRDGTAASVGDIVISRQNDRRLRSGRDWVCNGDRWRVTGVRGDGSLTVQRPGRRWGGSLVLPVDYVVAHIELGYAVTAHRAQGITTDTAHALIGPTTTRENLYVALTRGRESNIAYVVVDRPDDVHAMPRPGDPADATAHSVLYGVLQHVGAELSAHEIIDAEQDVWGSIAQLAAEYETIAAAAQHDRWAALIRASGLSDADTEDAIASDAFGPLAAELRRAEANHHDIDTLLPRLVAARGFTDVYDIAAVLHARVARATARPTGAGRTQRAPRMIAGLIPAATGAMSADMRQALDERRDLIEQRAIALVDAALSLSTHEAWIDVMGEGPRGPRQAEAWRQQMRVVAAYRDRYGITADSALGAPAANAAQRTDAALARIAMDRARQLGSGVVDAAARARRAGAERGRPSL